VLGKFDGTQFTPETGKLHAEYGEALYATQTWKLTIEGGPAYQIAWMRYPLDLSLTWNGQMSFPVELTLRAFPEGIRLCRQPIDAINNLRVSQQSWRDLSVAAGNKPVPEIDADLLDLRAEIKSAGATDFGLVVHGQSIRYSSADQTLRVGTVSAPLKLTNGTLQLRILADRSSIEMFADYGQVTIAAVTLAHPDHTVSLVAGGGPMRVVSLEANRLETIWPGSNTDRDSAEKK
jgi:sucrose-6-phosphate hydrolase SacC (GH32 family)